MRLYACRLLRLGGVAVLAVLMLCGCANSNGSRTHDALLEIPVPKSLTITADQVAGLGTILVDSHGMTLYMFPPDAGGRVTCTGACAGTWPPLVIASGSKPTAAAGVNPLDPHEAWEDTVMYPALRTLTTQRTLDQLAERFADLENNQYGDHALAQMIDRVSGIEEQLGIADLAAFTP